MKSSIIMKYSNYLKACIVSLGLISMSQNTKAQIITTIIGNGTAGYTGDGGPATSATMNTPVGVCCDNYGNIFFTDRDNNVIRKMDLSGNVTTIAGNGSAGFSGDGGPATDAQMNKPHCIVSGDNGKLYFTDQSSERVRVIVGGIISTIAGTGGSSSTGDGGPATAATLNNPYGLAVDTGGNVYIAESYGRKVRLITKATGIISTYAGNGSIGFSGDGGPATAAQFNYINCIYIDRAKNLYVSDNGNQKIRMVNAAGVINTIAGTTLGFSGDGGPATSAQLHSTAGIVKDTLGNVYICDAVNYRIRMINNTGIINTFAGNGTASYSGDGGPATLASMNFPQDLCIDNLGRLVIVDIINNRIRRIANPTSRPVFTSATASLSVCKDSAAKPINSLLSITDSSVGQTEIWSIVTAPAHGNLSGFSATATSTGGSITPTGLFYASTTGYVGNDTFRIKISDGYDADTITIPVIVSNCHLDVVTLSSKSTITIAPNPSKGDFTINVPSNKNEVVKLVITNLLGQRVSTLNIESNHETMVKLNQPAGVYNIMAITTDGITNQKVVIEQ